MKWIRRRTSLTQNHSTKRLLTILLLVTLGLGALFVTAYIAARLDLRDYDNQELHDKRQPAQH